MAIASSANLGRRYSRSPPEVHDLQLLHFIVIHSATMCLAAITLGNLAADNTFNNESVIGQVRPYDRKDGR